MYFNGDLRVFGKKVKHIDSNTIIVWSLKHPRENMIIIGNCFLGIKLRIASAMFLMIINCFVSYSLGNAVMRS